MPGDLNLIQIAVAVVGGYLLGSIPFGVLVMRAAGAGDPRAIVFGRLITYFRPPYHWCFAC